MYGEKACRSKFFSPYPFSKIFNSGCSPFRISGRGFLCLPAFSFPRTLAEAAKGRRPHGRKAGFDRSRRKRAFGGLRMLSLYRAFSHGKCSADCVSRRPPRRHKRNLFALLHAEASVSFSFDFVKSQSESALKGVGVQRCDWRHPGNAADGEAGRRQLFPAEVERTV